MRAWVDAFPVVEKMFASVEFWAVECELADRPGVIWRRVPQYSRFWRIQAIAYQLTVRRWMRRAAQRWAIVQCTGCFLPKADVRYIHFWNRALLEEAAARPESLALGPVTRWSTWLAARDEEDVARNSAATKWWWVVSRSLAKRIQAGETAEGDFETLPNQYDPRRFNPAQRLRWRGPMRERYQLGAHEIVLAFSAFGHFERKGLLQVMEAVSFLRAAGLMVRLLVLGGRDATISSFRKSLRRRGIDDSGTIFAGMVDEMDRHLSAADAFFFPSHFEAFSLAEIEAAALGLRLYLTPHYGSEMILREPENGRLLPWDSRGMANILEEEIKAGRIGTFHTQLGEALDPAGFRRRLGKLYEKALAS